MRWVIALDSISCRSFCNAEISCQVRSDLDDPTDKQVIEKLPLNPYLSKIGLAFVNCDLRVSPKVRITTLLGYDIPTTLLDLAWEKSAGNKIEEAISE